MSHFQRGKGTAQGTTCLHLHCAIIKKHSAAKIYVETPARVSPSGLKSMISSILPEILQPIVGFVLVLTCTYSRWQDLNSQLLLGE